MKKKENLKNFVMMYRFLSKIINLDKIEIPWKRKGEK